MEQLHSGEFAKFLINQRCNCSPALRSPDAICDGICVTSGVRMAREKVDTRADIAESRQASGAGYL